MTRIIVLSYGMRKHTKSALAQARRFGHPIHLVPAIPRATKGLRTHRSALVTVHDDVGRAGLLSALAGETGAVLLIHEDVLLHPDAATRLLDVANQRSCVAVPRTNHTDVDGPTGDLPPDVVQPLGPPVDPEPIERARNVCMAAPAARLRDLAQQRLTAANTRLFFPERTAVLVRDVVATHLDEGPDQLEEPVGPDGRPLLVASMIVRDEEMFLEDCLESLVGLVDRVDICDTGSTDRTLEIATAAGANIIQVEWRDDFAWARNQALEMSRDGWWVLQIDADERARIDDPIAFRRLLATAIVDADGFDVPLRDVGADGTELGGQQLPRIFPGASTVFRGRVHEVAGFSDGRPIAWTVTTALEIEHHGYRPEVVAARDKQGRNLRLARKDHEAHPTAITGLQMARSLPFGTERLEILQQLYDDIVAGDNSLNEAGQVPVYQLYAHALLRADRGDEAWRVITEARALFPYVPVVRAAHAEIGTRTQRHDEVLAAAKDAPPEGEGEGARPWQDALSDAVTIIELAKSQLATDDVEGAAASMRELLSRDVPGAANRWPEIAAITALTLPDEVIDLLLPHAASDDSGLCLAAVTELMDPEDAAAFAAEAARTAGTPGDKLRQAAWGRVIAADDGPAFDVLTGVADMTESEASEVAATAGPVIRARLRLRGIDVEALDLDAINAAIDVQLQRLAKGEGNVAAAAAAVAADPTGNGLQRLSRELPAVIAAPVAAAAVVRGLESKPDIEVAMVLCTMADDAEAAAQLREHLGRLPVEGVRVLRQRAADRGSTKVAGFLATYLFTRSS